MSSQNGEHLVLSTIISLLGNKVPHYSVEIGVDEPYGKIQCNTVDLLDEGWSGLLLDEDVVHHPMARQEYLTAENFEQILRKYLVPCHFGVLSIDIDGMDYWLWKALPSTYSPSLVIVEYNAEITGPDSARLTVPYDPEFRFDGTRYFGASAGAMVALAHEKGYRLLLDVAHVNLFFLRGDLYPSNLVEPSLPELGGRIVGPLRGDPLHREFITV